jgi:hypothetical protein
MPSIELFFVIILENLGTNTIHHHYGPLFTKWLPNGDADALTLKTDEPNIELKVWFSRRGAVQNGIIEFDYSKQDVDQNVMEQQAILEAGPLSGSFILTDLTEEELSVVEQDVKDDPLYVKLGKRITKLIHRPVSRLIRILRVNYGQYWICDVPKWDSRRESLGAYCANKLQLSWRCNQESSLQDFRPTNSTSSFNITLPSDEFFKQYLAREDFLQLSEILASDYDPALATTAILRAHENFDQGDLSYAIIEACTALEIAMSSYVRKTYEGSKPLEGAVSEFFNLKKEAQLFFISLGIEDISKECLELAIGGIKLRNSIVHEGYEPHYCKEVNDKVSALMWVTTKLLPGPFFRFPTTAPGNVLFAR